MSVPRVQFTVRQLMIVVVVFGAVFGLLTLAYREGNHQINLVESEYYHYRSTVETDPVSKAEWIKRAAYYDRMVRYYGSGR